MRFLAECNDSNTIHEIETEHGETSFQSLRKALSLKDPKVQEFNKLLSVMQGRNRTIVVVQNAKGQTRIEVYLRRQSLVG